MGRNGQVMSVDEVRFELAKERIIGKNRERQGIGTLSEKTVHAVLKHYYAPDTDMHEIPVEGYVADIYTGSEIIEIQTRSFNAMRKKLAAFLPLYPVTVVYPIPHTKWLSWIDETSGETSAKRKSPKRGSPYHAFAELYKIRPFLNHPHMKFRFALIDMEEYRLLNGWSHDKKRGSERYDRIPLSFVEEFAVDRREDYMQFVPYDLPEPFTAKDFAGSAKISVDLARTVLLLLYELEIVDRPGKLGRQYLYRIRDL